MRVRRLASVGTLAAVLAATAACAPSVPSSEGEGSSSDGGTVSLTVWSWQEDFEDQWAEIFDVFEASHPGIEVNFRGVAATEYDKVLATGLSGNDGPDVPFVRSYGALQPLVKGGNLEALDETVKGLASWPDAVKDGERGAEDGKLYAVPFAMQTLQIFYNKQLFEDAGVAVPTTWDKFLDACDTFKEKGVTPMANGVKDAWALPIHLANFGATRYGGPEFDKALLAGETTFTDPAYVDAIQTVDDVVSRCFIDDPEGVSEGDALALFASGQGAMRSGGSWEIAQLENDSGQDVGLFSAPPTTEAEPSGPLTPGYVDGGIGLNSKSEHKEEALELLNWMTTKEFGDLLMDKLAQPSVVPNSETSSPLLQEALDNYREHPTPYLEYASFGYGSPDAWTLAQNELQAVVLDQQDPEGAASSIQRGIAQWFEPKG